MQSSHTTQASYARHVRPELCVQGAAAEVLACMYAGHLGMQRLEQDLLSDNFEQCKLVPGKAGKAMNRSYLSQYIKHCLIHAGVQITASVPEDFDWQVSDHLLYGEVNMSGKVPIWA